MKFYIIAGEASGDLHSSNLVKSMRSRQSDATFRGFGGDKMKAAGVELVKHYRETAFMGFWEVVKHLRKILGYIDLCKKDILEWKPDAIILVDYPGFNLRIAEFAKKNGFRVFYYISPQVWAWKSSRVNKIRRDVERMFVIIPFEVEFYKRWNYDVEFVGHPLLDEVRSEKPPLGSEQSSAKNQKLKEPDSNIVAILPGSRKQEIGTMLPLMLQVVDDFPEQQFVIAGVNTAEEIFYRSIIGEKKCELVFDQTYSLLSKATAALVTSGTATMETALHNVPQIVCYKGSTLSYFIARRLVDVKYIAMPNLILDRPLLKELIQQDLNRKNLREELNRVLYNNERRNEIETGYAELRQKLGGEGASMRTAEKILELMSKK